MLTKSVLSDIVEKQRGQRTPKGQIVERQILSGVLRSFGDNRILVLTGIRRCGKSTLLRQIMRKKGGCYVNFEDERFIEFGVQEFEKLNEVLIEVYGEQDVYFFDEIQNIDKFELFVRRLQDDGKKIVITGSNASLLSKEFGTRLTGRYKQFELYPFSFREFLAFRNINPDKSWLHSAGRKTGLIKMFREYERSGGMPEYLENADPEYIKTLYENIIYRDVIARYAIRKQKVVRGLSNILASNMSSRFTYNSLRRSLNLSNAITAKEYVSYLSNSYIFFELLRFDFSIKRQLNMPRKIYAVDPAFRETGLSFTADRGRILENIVFMELKRRGKEAYYFSEKQECDFVIREGGRISEAIQVCFELNGNNRQREIGGLTAAMEKFKLDSGLILTSEQDDEIAAGGGKISVIPVWKWLLGFK